MSKFSVPVIQIGEVSKHPNADSLSLTQAEGCNVVFRTGEFSSGDLAVYVPIDSILPLDRPQFAFLRKNEGQTKHRLRAAKLRGIFSMGLLVPFKPCSQVDAEGKPLPASVWLGQDMAEDLGIVKYEEPEQLLGTGGDSAKDPGLAPKYDMESYRKHKRVLVPEEVVVVTEKIHGCNGRFLVDKDGVFHVGSHRRFVLESETNVWWRVARALGLEEKLRAFPNMVLYGEVYGSVQDLRYGTGPGELKFAAFDIFDSATGTWLDFDVFDDLCRSLDVPMVPVLYKGPYRPEVIEPLAEGKSTLADHIREGLVIKPVVERRNYETGRTLLKLVSESYLLRKGGTERH